MAKCNLSIELDGDPKTVHVGDRLSGRVRVNVDSDCRCNGLKVSFGWRTHGRGNRSSHDAWSEVLFTGDWKAGESHSYEFSCDVPFEMPSYQGTYLNVEHAIVATADIPWAFDPKAERELIVVQDPDDDRLLNTGHTIPVATKGIHVGPPPTFTGLSSYVGRSAAEVPKASVEELDKTLIEGANMLANYGWCAAGCMGIFALPFIVIGISIALSDIGGFGMIFGAIFAGAGCLFLGAVFFMTLRNTVAQRKLGKPDFRFEPTSIAYPGGDVELVLTVTPEVDLAINRITATLRGKEVCVSGSGTNKTTHTHSIYEIPEILQDGGQLRGGERKELRARITLPPDAPLSFSSSDNNIKHELALHIDIPRWPDWTCDLPVIVMPEAVGRILRGEAAGAPRAALKAEAAAVSAAAPPASAPAASPSAAAVPAELMLLERALAELADAGFESQRRKVFTDFEVHDFSFGLVADAVQGTSGLDVSEACRGGKTVTGSVAGLSRRVAVRFPAVLNEDVESLGPGDEVAVGGRLVGWSDIGGYAIFEAQL